MKSSKAKRSRKAKKFSKAEKSSKDKKSSKVKNSGKVKNWPKGQQIQQGQVSNSKFQIVYLSFNIIADTKHTYYTLISLVLTFVVSFKNWFKIKWLPLKFLVLNFKI